MSTGQPAFAGADRGAIFDAILNREPVSITRLNYAVPPDLERIVRKALAKRPDERYQNALDLLTDLRTLRRQTESGAEPAPVVRGRFPTWMWLTGLATGLAVIGGLWWKSANRERGSADRHPEAGDDPAGVGSGTGLVARRDADCGLVGSIGEPRHLDD